MFLFCRATHTRSQWVTQVCNVVELCEYPREVLTGCQDGSCKTMFVSFTFI